jgi:hypothetical protein
MPVIAIHQVKPGMVLENPVTNFMGSTLLKSGVILTEDHIVTLKTWGIKTVIVYGKDEHHSLKQTNELACNENNIEKLEQMFERVKDQPGMTMIYQIVREQAQNCSTGQKL